MPRRSAKDAANTRARIINVAQTLFAEHGYADVSTARIAATAGMTDGALFHHFKDKKSLFREIVVKLQAEVHKSIYKATIPAKTAIEGFLLGARESMRVTQEPAYQRIVITEAPSVLGRAEWGDIDAKMGLKLIESSLQMIAAARDLPHHILKPMAMLTLGVMTETTFAMARKETGVDPDQCIALLERTLLDWVERDVKPWQMATKPDQAAKSL